MIFQAIDTNGDGQIASDEFQIYFASFGLTDTKFAIEIFKELDTNHDMALSQQGNIIILFSNLKKKLIFLI